MEVRSRTSTDTGGCVFTIRKCSHCDGSGHVVGMSTWEIPVSDWAGPEHDAVERMMRMHVCDRCNGTGTLITSTERRKPRGRYTTLLGP